MKRFTRKNRLFLIRSWVGWSLAIAFLQFFRFYGIPESVISQEEIPQMPVWLVMGLGILAGTLFVIQEYIYDSPKIRRLPFGVNLLVRLTGSFVTVGIMLFLLAICYINFQEGLSSSNVQQLDQNDFFRFVFMLFVFISLVSSFFSFIRQVDQKFGPGVIFDLLSGKYFKPREERRVFLFIDLKDSTTIAEAHGHLLFSKLLQDCFFDLNDVFPQYKAAVYQYVGDEAILTWYPGDGLKDSNCIKVFFAFMDILESKREYYMKHYGLFPVFKAGGHIGTVTTTEIGVVKKEIAYHGDVMNTTARIQSICNSHNEQLLISKKLLKSLTDLQGFQTRDLGEIKLKGKKKPQKVFAIQRV